MLFISVDKCPLYLGVFCSCSLWLWKTILLSIVIHSKSSRINEGNREVMHNALWQSVLGEIELSISTANFQTWFKDTELIDSSEDEVVIAVKNIFAKIVFYLRI